METSKIENITVLGKLMHQCSINVLTLCCSKSTGGIFYFEIRLFVGITLNLVAEINMHQICYKS